MQARLTAQLDATVWDLTLTVSDLAQAIEFYRGLLGLPLKYAFRDYAGWTRPQDLGRRGVKSKYPNGNTLQLTEID